MVFDRGTLVAAALAAAALVASSGEARADEQDKRRRGPYLALLFGGGLIDAHALYGEADIQTLGNGSMGSIEAVLRGGYRTDLGLSPIVEGRGALILGTVTGNLASSFSALGGVQWNPWLDAVRSPYVNLRGGVRTYEGNRHGTVAFGLGLDLGRGQPFTAVEASIEPLTPWLITLRVGAVF